MKAKSIFEKLALSRGTLINASKAADSGKRIISRMLPPADVVKNMRALIKKRKAQSIKFFNAALDKGVPK